MKETKNSLLDKTYHVRRSEIAHDEFVLCFSNDLSNLVCDTLNAHFRFLVVCRNLRGRYHVSLLILKLLLHSAIEEEGDVRVLFRFW